MRSRATLFAAVVMTAALGAGTAQASSAGQLSAIASSIAGQAVTVTCAPKGGMGGSAIVGLPHITLGSEACRSASKGAGEGVLLLLHEYEHTTGIADETQAQCHAFGLLKRALTRYWGLSQQQAQSRYQDAWAYSLSQPAAYRATRC